MRDYLFDDSNSIIHYVLGLFSALLLFKLWWVSYIVFHIFLVYELLEYENPLSTVGDIVEYICGFLAGLMIASGLYLRLYT